MTLVIVGLGNPGKEYESTYHNAGWRAVDALSGKLGKKLKKAECSSLTWTGNVGGEKIVLAKPLTYMNLSGEAVKSLISKYGGEPIVIYDDIDLPLGVLRARTAGSAGTHNGMRDIVEKLGRTDFCQVLEAATAKLADKLCEYLNGGRDFEKLMREIN